MQGKLAQNWVRHAGQAMSGASPWLQWRVGKCEIDANSCPLLSKCEIDCCNKSNGSVRASGGSDVSVPDLT